MAKGSQLSQLKSALSQAGVTGNQQSGRKRKRTGSQEKDKEKRAAKLDEIHKKLNPFDVKVTKLKHEVGGRKLKGVTGKPSQSKQAGVEQRKKTLLVEYEEKGRAGGIVDRRFGENDPTMTLEERMLERFTKERQRSSRGAAFNLEDEDELTHYGQSLSKLDDFDTVGLGLEDEEDAGQLNPDLVGKTHFGGFSDDEEEDADHEQPERKKSKAEVMAEVMAKSKEYRLRRQMEREQEDNVRHELDQEFDSLRDLIYAPDPSSSGSNSIPLGSAPKPIVEVEPHDLDYDQRVRELAFDARAKPTDRTKTEEELAIAEKEALEKAERRRRKRMLGLDESDSEDEEGRSKKKRKRGADDLDDDFDDSEDWGGIGAGLEAKSPVRVGKDGDSSASEEEDEAEGEDDEDGESSDGDEDDEEDPEATGEHEDLIASAKPSKRKSKAPDKELPFTFPCPATHDEFLEIVDNLDAKDVPTVVQRIRTLYHTSLAPENKYKLQVLTGVLIDHILYISSPPEPRFDVASSLLSHLFTLVRAYPIQAAENFVQKLSLMHKNLKRGLSHGALDPQSKTWPGLAELSLLRIIGATWPTSDLNHAVISSTRVLMGAYLGLGRVRSLSDLASGLFLCTLFMQFEELSKRFVPEAVNFAINSVLHLAPHAYKDVSALPGAFPAPDFRSELSRDLSVDPSKVEKMVLKADLVALMAAGAPTEEGKAQLLGLALELLSRFADMYKALEGFVDLYEPIYDILQNIREQSLAGDLQTRLSSVKDITRRLLKFAREARQPLLLQAHKPIPIPTYIPKFEASRSSYLRRQDPDHERNEAAKLRSQYKQERKGAIRELRKDARFLAGVEQKKQAEKDRAYNEGLKKVYGSIQTERAEEKAMEREKSREKKRSGRK